MRARGEVVGAVLRVFGDSEERVRSWLNLIKLNGVVLINEKAPTQFFRVGAPSDGELGYLVIALNTLSRSSVASTMVDVLA